MKRERERERERERKGGRERGGRARKVRAERRGKYKIKNALKAHFT